MEPADPDVDERLCALCKHRFPFGIAVWDETDSHCRICADWRHWSSQDTELDELADGRADWRHWASQDTEPDVRSDGEGPNDLTLDVDGLPYTRSSSPTVFDYRVHLSASRVADWLGYQAHSGVCQGIGSAGRENLIEKWFFPRPPATGNPIRRFTWGGRTNELRARDAYVRLFAVDPMEVVRATMREHPSEKYLAAIPDYLVGEDGLLEIKCPLRLVDHGPDETVELDTKWLLQVHLQLEIFDRKWCDLLVWHPDYVWIWRVYRDHVRLHDKYTVSTRFKRALGQDQFTTFEQCDGPKTLWDVALPEYRKYQAAIDSRDQPDGMSHEALLRCRNELSAFRGRCVHKLCVKQSGIVAWEPASAELAVDPRRYALIDRLSNPLSPLLEGERRLVASRCLSVRWFGGYTKDYWTYHRGKNGDAAPRTATNEHAPPRGGYIRSEYFPSMRLAVDEADPERRLVVTDVAIASADLRGVAPGPHPPTTP